MFYKGDARAPLDVRVECKTTQADSYRLKLSEIVKIQTEAITGGEESWAMQIEFQDQYSSKKVAVIDWLDYLHFRELKKEAESK